MEIRDHNLFWMSIRILNQRSDPSRLHVYSFNLWTIRYFLVPIYKLEKHRNPKVDRFIAKFVPAELLWAFRKPSVPKIYNFLLVYIIIITLYHTIRILNRRTYAAWQHTDVVIEIIIFKRIFPDSPSDSVRIIRFRAWCFHRTGLFDRARNIIVTRSRVGSSNRHSIITRCGICIHNTCIERETTRQRERGVGEGCRL